METKIHIIDLCTRLNKGDAGIILGMINDLNKTLDNPSISVATFTPQEDIKLYQKYNITVVRNLIGSPRYNTPFTNSKSKIVWAMMLSVIAVRILLFILLMRVFNIRIYKLLTKEEKLAIDKYISADIIISCGGGFLLGGFGSVIHLLNIFFGILLKKPVVIYAQSIGPFYSKILIMFARYVLNRVTLITVREKVSLEYLKKMKVKKEAILVADAAFSLPNPSSSDIASISKRYDLPKKRVGLTVRYWKFPHSKDKKERIENYINTIARFIDFLWVKYKMHTVFIPQVILTPSVKSVNIEKYSDDREIASLIKTRVKHKSKFIIIKEDLSPLEIKALIGGMDYFVGTRMHSNIFALSMYVPTIAIEYLPKTRGIMRMLNLEEYVIPIDKVSLNILKDKFEQLLHNKTKIKEKLRKNIPKVKKLSKKPAEIVRNILT
ncbi:MAG: polysaccharide pyruvyl transferase family protein [Nanoarchaeota archaeon]|nr:polysaccharide pyruvyl transferase family protein [Nanoarchaeota archaeon]